MKPATPSLITQAEKYERGPTEASRKERGNNMQAQERKKKCKKKSMQSECDKGQKKTQKEFGKEEEKKVTGKGVAIPKKEK